MNLFVSSVTHTHTISCRNVYSMWHAIEVLMLPLGIVNLPDTVHWCWWHFLQPWLVWLLPWSLLVDCFIENVALIELTLHFISFSHWVYLTMAYTGRFLQSVFSEGTACHELIISVMQTNFVIKATRPHKLSSLVTVGLFGVNRHYCIYWIRCKSTWSLISVLAELLFICVALCIFT